MRIIPIIIIGASLISPLAAQIVLTPPVLASEEIAVYHETRDGKPAVVEQRLRLVTEAGNPAWLEFSARSPSEDTIVRIDPVSFQATGSDTTIKQKTSTIRRTTTVINNSVQAKADELVVNDYASLGVVLRGFPFEKTKFARIVFLGSESSSMFSFELTITGKETLKLNGISWECWKVQLGLSGFLGGLAGKTNLWYSTTPTRVLVRAEGAMGPPGSPMRIIEIKSYETKNVATN